MSKARLICTAEMELPDDALDASQAQTKLLTIWKQFSEALPAEGLSGVALDARVVKSKPKDPKTPAEPATPAAAQSPTGDNIPGFLKR